MSEGLVEKSARPFFCFMIAYLEPFDKKLNKQSKKLLKCSINIHIVVFVYVSLLPFFLGSEIHMHKIT